ncbi:MAG TPA: trigger factor [Candidatus Woesebacteria bacterium]|nr:trigger factor [Candidatus Woesebacteria bacterium]HOG37630.1 trigger factor [Candidatus Woesebacteria bacterium]
MTPNSSIQKLKDKSFILNLEIKVEDIRQEYQKTLKSIQLNFETKGFRKGKAPLDVVESQISPQKIFEEVATNLISYQYSDAVKDHHLRPITQPQIKFKTKNPDLEHSWQIEITGSELPKISLNQGYLKEIKSINQDKSIPDDNAKLDKIIQALVKHSKLDLPEILIQSDLQHHLSHLIDQANQAGITVQQYLESHKQTLENYQDELKKRIVQEWTINLAITQIAKDNKIEVSESETKDLLAKNPSLSQNTNMLYYLLTQQKVFEFLKKQ